MEYHRAREVGQLVQRWAWAVVAAAVIVLVAVTGATSTLTSPIQSIYKLPLPILVCCFNTSPQASRAMCAITPHRAAVSRYTESLQLHQTRGPLAGQQVTLCAIDSGESEARFSYTGHTTPRCADSAEQAPVTSRYPQGMEWMARGCPQMPSSVRISQCRAGSTDHCSAIPTLPSADSHRSSAAAEVDDRNTVILAVQAEAPGTATMAGPRTPPPGSHRFYESSAYAHRSPARP